MAQKCADCGKELSFWSRLFPSSRKLCPGCKNARREKIKQYVSKLNEFGADRYLTPAEERELAALQQSLGLSDEDLKEARRTLANLRQSTKNFDLARYEEKLRQVGEDGYLEPQEEAELNALKEELGLSDEEIAPTCGQLIRLKRLTAIKNGKLPVLAADILLKKGELCHFEVSCDLVEEKSRTRYVGGSQGVSFRIAKGVYYRVGGFKGERVVDTYKQVTDSGTLYITNKRVVFAGTKKNVTYPLNKIVNFVKYRDAVQFQKENEARPKYFLIKEQDIIDEIGLILTQLVSAGA
ncbi:MAG: hypothetical protein AB1556_13925 [Bacillota bacterium]